eukprot:tig00000042_g15420.t1
MDDTEDIGKQRNPSESSGSDQGVPVLMDLRMSASGLSSGLPSTIVSPSGGSVVLTSEDTSKDPSFRRVGFGQNDEPPTLEKYLRSSPLTAEAALKRRKTVSLNLCIIPLIVVVLVSAVVVVTVFSYVSSQAATSRLSTYFLDQISHRVSERFKELQQAGERTAMSLVLWIVGAPLKNTVGAPNSYLKEALGLFNSQQIGVPKEFTSKHFPVISQLYLQSLSIRGYEPFEYLGFGLPNRENLLVKREKASFGKTYPDAAEPYFSIVEYRLNGTIPGQIDRYTSYVTAGGTRKLYSLVFDDQFDVRKRPFYTIPQAARRQVWTPVIPFVFGLSGFLCATPVYTSESDELKAVVTIGFQSDSLSNYLQQIEVAQNGFAALIADDMDGKRRAIAFKSWQLAMRPVKLNPTQGTAWEFVPTDELTVPELRETLKAMPGDVHDLPIAVNALGKYELLRLPFVADGTEFDGRLLRIMGAERQTSELSLAMVVAAPSKDILGEVRLLTVVNAVVCSIASFLALSVGIFVLLEISKNMRQLKLELGRLSFFDSQLSPTAAGGDEGLVTSLGPVGPQKPRGTRGLLVRWLGRARGGSGDHNDDHDEPGASHRSDKSTQFRSVLKELDQVGEAFTRMKHALAVVATIGDAVIVLDEAGAVVQMNSSARRMFGVTGEPARFAQRPVHELFRLGADNGGPLFQRLLRGEYAGPVSGCTIECTALAQVRIQTDKQTSRSTI